MLIPKIRPRGRIDKSALTFGEPIRIRDRKWLNSANGATCWNCGAQDGTVIKAHIRWGQRGGASLKPGDDETVDLCGLCHADQESKPGPEWWANCLVNYVKRLYALAKQSQRR